MNNEIKSQTSEAARKSKLEKSSLQLLQNSRDGSEERVENQIQKSLIRNYGSGSEFSLSYKINDNLDYGNSFEVSELKVYELSYLTSSTKGSRARHRFGISFGSYVDSFIYSPSPYFNTFKLGDVQREEGEMFTSTYGLNYDFVIHFPINGGIFSKFIIESGLEVNLVNTDNFITKEIVIKEADGFSDTETNMIEYTSTSKYYHVRPNFKAGLEMSISMLKLSTLVGVGYSHVEGKAPSDIKGNLDASITYRIGVEL